MVGTATRSLGNVEIESSIAKRKEKQEIEMLIKALFLLKLTSFVRKCISLPFLAHKGILRECFSE
jgi:hypothetical protein